MKKALFILAACGLFAFSAFAQKPVDFSGSWEFDASRSKVGGFGSPGSFIAAQGDKELKVVRKRPQDSAPDEGLVTVSTGSDIYPLDGKENKGAFNGPMGPIEVVRRAKLEDGKLKLSTTFDRSLTNTEVWSLSADGKTLTITSITDTSNGPLSSTLVYIKK